jgi:hypothetical protein
MGISKVAAAMAALLAGLLIATSLAAGRPTDNAQRDYLRDGRNIETARRIHNLRGQAWATELFGRRYGRELLAAVRGDNGTETA